MDSSLVSDLSTSSDCRGSTNDSCFTWTNALCYNQWNKCINISASQLIYPRASKTQILNCLCLYLAWSHTVPVQSSLKFFLWFTICSANLVTWLILSTSGNTCWGKLRHYLSEMLVSCFYIIYCVDTCHAFRDCLTIYITSNGKNVIIINNLVVLVLYLFLVFRLFQITVTN